MVTDVNECSSDVCGLAAVLMGMDTNIHSVDIHVDDIAVQITAMCRDSSVMRFNIADYPAFEKEVDHHFDRILDANPGFNDVFYLGIIAHETVLNKHRFLN